DGDLANWQHRLKLLAPSIADLGLQGFAKGDASVSFTPRKVDVTSARLTVKNFGMILGGSPIHDPNVELQAALNYTADPRAIELRDSQIKSDAFNAHTGKLVIDLAKGTMAGSVVYKGDLGKMQAWYGPIPPGVDHWSGAMFGQADLKSDADGCDVNIKT